MVNVKITFVWLRVRLISVKRANVLEVNATCILTSKMDERHELTNSMEQSPPWEANSSSASQGIPGILGNPKAYCRVHKPPPPVPSLSSNGSVHVRNHCCRAKAISIRYSECVFVALIIHHANVCIFVSVFCPPVPYFSTLSHKPHDFRKKHKTCFDFLYNFCSKHCFLRRIQRETILNGHKFSCKVPVFSCWNLNFVDGYPKKHPSIKFNENPSSGSWVASCGLTDMTKLIVSFRNFVTRLETCQLAS
jgi:hypothetical protein